MYKGLNYFIKITLPVSMCDLKSFSVILPTNLTFCWKSRILLLSTAEDFLKFIDDMFSLYLCHMRKIHCYPCIVGHCVFCNVSLWSFDKNVPFFLQRSQIVFILCREIHHYAGLVSVTGTTFPNSTSSRSCRARRQLLMSHTTLRLTFRPLTATLMPILTCISPLSWWT